MANKEDIARRFGLSAPTYDSASTAQQRAVKLLVNALNGHIATGSDIFEVGCGTGSLTREIMLHNKPHLYIANDISEGMLAQLAANFSANILSTMHGDAETLPWPTEMDAILSASAIQWFDNPFNFIDKSVISLKKGGIAGIITYGPETFHELQALGIRGLHYPSLDEWQQYINNSQLTLMAIKKETIILHYKTPLDVMKDLQRAGVTSSDQQVSAGSMRSLLRHYGELFSTPQGISLTYEVYLIICKK